MTIYNDGLQSVIPRFYEKDVRDKQREGVDFGVNGLLLKPSRMGSIYIPPRCGKSHIARMIALAGVELGIYSGVLFLTYTDFLRNQMVPDLMASDRKLREKNKDLYKKIHTELQNLFGIPMGKFRDLNMKHGVNYSPAKGYFPNDEHLVATTDAMFLSHWNTKRDSGGGLAQEYMKARMAETGKPMLIIVDEGHVNSESNSFGMSIINSVELGNYALLMTGTPYRADSKRIPGFDWVLMEEPEDVAFSRSKSHPEDDTKRIREFYEGEKKTWKLNPDVKMEWQDAFNRKFLCHMVLRQIDGPVTIEVGPKGSAQEITSKLSELLTVETARAGVRSAARQPDMVEKGVKKLIIELETQRCVNKKAAGLVFVGNDYENDKYNDIAPNFVANMVQDYLARFRPGWDCRIATSADGSEAQRKLISFQPGSNIDVMIVKSMAGMGNDWPHVKVGLDLSTVRARASSLQRMTRVLTPYEGMMRGIWITLRDMLASKNAAFILDAQGVEEGITEIEAEKVGEEIVDKTDPDERIRVTCDGAGEVTGTDETLEEMDEYSINAVNEFIKEKPGFANVAPSELYKHMIDIGVVEEYAKRYKEEEFEDFDREERAMGNMGMIQELRKRCWACVNELAIRQLGASSYGELSDPDREAYGPLVASVWNLSKREANLPARVQVKQIIEIPKLERLLSALRTMGATK